MWHQSCTENHEKMPHIPRVPHIRRERGESGGNMRTGADMEMSYHRSVCASELSNNVRDRDEKDSEFVEDEFHFDS
jgi:hypothetical protein